MKFFWLKVTAAVVVLFQNLPIVVSTPSSSQSKEETGDPTEVNASGGECALKYPRIVIGCWQLTERVREQSKALHWLATYVESGFTTFDTADIYGPSEAILGDLRRKHHSPESPIRVFTKFVTQDATISGARRVNAKSASSLGAPPDMVQFHWWDYSDERFVDAARNLVTLQGEGLLGDVSACNFDTPHLRRLVDAGLPIVANQVQYSLLDRRPENGMVAYARAHGIRLAVFGTVAGGWLSDKYLGQPEPRNLDTVSMRMYKASLDRWSSGDWGLFQELLQVLRTIADKHDSSIANVAVAWVLDQLGPDGGWAILGARDAVHIEEHVSLKRWVAESSAGGGEVRSLLDRDDRKLVTLVLSKGRGPVGDIWSHERR